MNVDAKMEPGPGRKPGVACNKHQGRELKTSTISFQNPSCATCVKQRLSIKNIIQAKRFLPSNSQPSQVFQTFCSSKGSKKVIFLDTSLKSKNPSENRSRHGGPPQFKNTCGHKYSQGVENKCLRRCKTMEKQRRKTSVAYVQKESKLLLFFAR